MLTFGKRLKELREEKRLSQKSLADAMYVAQRTVFAWENNIQEPDMETICKLAKFFEVTTDDILGLDKSYNPEYIKRDTVSTTSTQIYTMSPLDRTFKGTIVEQLNDEELGRIKESVIILANGIKSNRTLRRQEQEAAKLMHKNEK